MKPKYTIGDRVYLAIWDQEKVWTTCQECGGTKHLRVILWDGTEHAIECQGCRSGYLGALGQVSHYERKPKAELCEIIGVEIQNYREPARISYKLSFGANCYNIDDDRLFDNSEEALKKASRVCEEENKIERDRIHCKVKDHRSWSWHMHYHRRAIRDAERNLKYHTEALGVAKLKSKEIIS